MRDRLVLAQLLGLALIAGCAQDGGTGGDGGGGPSRDGGIDYDALTPGLTVTPPEVTVDVQAGGAPATAAFTATVTTGGKDVTSAATWFVDDQTLGTMAGPTFTAQATKGGTTHVHAVWNGMTGDAIVHVKIHASVGGGASCPGCPTFPDLGGASCGAPTTPTIVYPPDGVLLPPNMNVMQVQFQPGTGTTYYEVDFEGPTVDVRVETRCNPIVDTRGAQTGGCSYDLDQGVWDYVAQSSRGGAAVKVSVRATQDGSCATPSDSRDILFAEEDLAGALYYWQSITVGGVAGKTGGIYRYDFGARGTTSEPFITPAQGYCVGCHFLSRDGARMTYGTDDADSDDEYGDLSAHLLDVATRSKIATTYNNAKPLPPGFQTFNHDHTRLMASQGQSQAASSFWVWDGDQGGSQIAMASTLPWRGTQPDWSADDRSVVYVVPKRFANQFNPPYSHADDDHFLGGSLWTIRYEPSSMTFGAAQPLLTSQGENNYYPSYSPDTPASFIVFNRTDAPELTTDLSQDAFNNPYAKVWLLSTQPGSSPIEAKALNADTPNTNSWPRWSPFVQTYQGKRLLWVTFSSTRDYGLKVRNHVKVPDASGAPVDQMNCYPPDSPQNPTGSHQQPLPPNCNQPQIWMAAINLSTAEFGTDDPSYPAFWLPFQDVGAHNHIAQWAEKIVTQPTCNDAGTPVPDGGVQCLGPGAGCAGNVCGTCCAGLICDNGTCQMSIM